jgi:gamma-butyrobetaine dioxygenase
MAVTRARVDQVDPADRIARLAPEPNALILEWAAGGSDRFHHVWLRDNCLCPRCRHASGQRLIDPLDLPADPKPRAASLDGDGALVIRWEPDGHDSRYPASWLRRHAYGSAARAERRRRPVLWGREIGERLPEGRYAQAFADPAEERRWLGLLLDHGFALLRGVPIENGQVAAVGDRIGFVRVTNYGRLFDVVSVPDPNNLAYTAAALGVHTDNPYRDPTPGYQLLHCLEAGAPGGDTLLVDGFRAADQLRAEDPEALALLARHARPFRFADVGADLVARFPVIGLGPEGEVREIHFNERSAAPLDLTEELVEPYYRAYRRFAAILRRPENELVIRLAPGDLLVMENGRALHGRTGFDTAAGRRWLQGCYVDKDGVESRLRVLERQAGEGTRP